jgi:hypothetical protein
LDLGAGERGCWLAESAVGCERRVEESWGELRTAELNPLECRGRSIVVEAAPSPTERKVHPGSGRSKKEQTLSRGRKETIEKYTNPFSFHLVDVSIVLHDVWKLGKQIE